VRERERERERCRDEMATEKIKKENTAAALPESLVKGNGLAERERERERKESSHTHSLIVYYRSNNNRYRCTFVSRDCSGV
jgi:hypothetical protein